MDIRELLGDELYSQVAEKLGDKKIAVVSDGTWIPKAKFDEVNEAKNEFKTMLEQRDSQLEELKGKAQGHEQLSAEIESLKKLNNETKTEYENRIKEQQFSFALEQAIRDAKARNPKAVKALINSEAVTLNDGQLNGLKEQLDALRESDSYLFDTETKNVGKGSNPGASPEFEKNPWSKKSFNLTEQGRIWREDPALADRMKKLAKNEE